MAFGSLLPWLQDASILAGPGGFNPTPQEQLDGVDPGVIEVTAPPKEQFDQTQQELKPSYRNSDILEELRMIQDQNEKASGRRGMFGIKGTLRDVLGFVGDTLSVADGGEMNYVPRRERERASDAMAGFTDNPLAAIERLANINPELAQEAYKQYQTSENQRLTRESLQTNRQSLMDDRRYKTISDMSDYAARMLEAAGDDAAGQERALAAIANRAKVFGISLEDLGLGPNMQPEDFRTYAGGDMTVNQQRNLPLRERTVATGEKNATTNRIRANRPTNPPPRPRADTAIETYERYSKIPERQRTPEQKAWMRMYIDGKGESDGGFTPSRGGPPPARNPIKINGRTFTPVQ